MNRGTIKNKNIISGVAILMLLLAIPSGLWPYGYYVILRWVVASTALFVLSIANKLRRVGWVWLMTGIAILFNPLIPIHLDKETWVVIDFITATLFLVSIFKIKSPSLGNLSINASSSKNSKNQNNYPLEIL